MRRKHKVGFAAALGAVVLGLLLVGMWVGARVAARRVRRHVESMHRGEFLGPQLAPDERALVAACYEDPARALAEMDQISWVPPPVPVPFVGHAPAPGRSGNAEIGAHHFRDARDLRSKPEGVRRIFIVGGSTAYGSGAPSQDRTVAGLLEAQLDARAGGARHEVVTAAYPGWASTQELLLTAQHITKFEPDLVVALSGVNDIHWSVGGVDVAWFHAYGDKQLLGLLEKSMALAGLEPFPEFAPGPRIPGPEHPPLPPADVAARLFGNARRCASVLEMEGARYLFALQPTLASTGKALTARERAHIEDEQRGDGVVDYFRTCYERIRTDLRDRRPVSFVDLTQVFDEVGADRDVFIDSYHFADRGNALVAARLVEPVLELLDEAR